ncbi:hypothetical protein ACP70R_026114 [Stipagrostis hirtigluma subsp. patula]
MRTSQVLALTLLVLYSAASTATVRPEPEETTCETKVLPPAEPECEQGKCVADCASNGGGGAKCDFDGCLCTVCTAPVPPVPRI